MMKYENIYEKPQDKFWFAGEKNCIEKATSFILKARYYNNPKLMSIFLEDITLAFVHNENKIINANCVKKPFILNRIVDTGDIPVNRLKHNLDKYGEVVAVISTNKIPYRVDYDVSILDIDSGKHAIAVIGYDQSYFYVLEWAKYIGNGYDISPMNPSIGRIKIVDFEACLEEYFECMELVCDLGQHEAIDSYEKSIIQKIKQNQNRKNEEKSYGLTALKELYHLFREGTVTYELYTNENIMEVSNLIKAREVIKYKLIGAINNEGEKESIEATINEDNKNWTKFMRLLMRRRSNDPARRYDNGEIGNLLNSIYEKETNIYKAIEQYL
ncbi:MAG: hypothetical protein FWE14_03770 [Lachnospiraceae bacterium]|nr:hypothetical protein [Lachnospiraceae bacterium]